MCIVLWGFFTGNILDHFGNLDCDFLCVPDGRTGGGKLCGVAARLGAD